MQGRSINNSPIPKPIIKEEEDRNLFSNFTTIQQINPGLNAIHNNNKRPGDLLVNPGPGKEFRNVSISSTQQDLLSNFPNNISEYLSQFDLNNPLQDIKTIIIDVGNLCYRTGMAYTNLQDHERAKTAFEACLRYPVYLENLTNLKLGFLYYNLAITYLNLNEYEKAKEAFKACFNYPQYVKSTDIRFGKFHYNLAIAYLNSNGYKEAKETFKVCFECPVYMSILEDIERGALNYNLAIACFCSHDYKEGKKALQACLKYSKYIQSLTADQRLQLEGLAFKYLPKDIYLL